MSDRIVTGIRLLRAVFEAQRGLDEISGLTGRRADALWCERSDVLKRAKDELAEFENAPLPLDWKAKQAGER
jgi:type II secretory pathway component PulK